MRLSILDNGHRRRARLFLGATIFEITVAATVGAALRSFEAGRQTIHPEAA